MAAANYDPDTLSVGVLGRPHGVRGDIYFRPHNPKSRAFDDLAQLWLVREGQSRLYVVTSMRPVADAYVAHLEGVDERDAAAALTTAEVRVRRADLPPLEPGEYFVEDVVGCAVEHEDGRALGVFPSGGGDGRGRNARLLPDRQGPAQRPSPLLPGMRRHDPFRADRTGCREVRE